jgi:hypothetical protein
MVLRKNDIWLTVNGLGSPTPFCKKWVFLPTFMLLVFTKKIGALVGVLG